MLKRKTQLLRARRIGSRARKSSCIALLVIGIVQMGGCFADIPNAARGYYRPNPSVKATGTYFCARGTRWGSALGDDNAAVFAGRPEKNKLPKQPAALHQLLNRRSEDFFHSDSGPASWGRVKLVAAINP